jgi:hypothetical protein
MTPFYESNEPSLRQRIAFTSLVVCASVPLYGGIKAVNREVGWYDSDLNGLFPAFLRRFPHTTFSIFANAPLAQTKMADLGCQNSGIREVGWQKELLGALPTGMKPS